MTLDITTEILVQIRDEIRGLREEMAKGFRTHDRKIDKVDSQLRVLIARDAVDITERLARLEAEVEELKAARQGAAPAR